MSQVVLLWSKRQNALHIEPVDRMLSSNRNCYRDDRASDYLPIHIGTREECDAAAEACRSTLAARQFFGETV
jgi:hypothetical protein